MTDQTLGPAERPCGSCPYRQDAPSGLWHETMYDQLPPYDEEQCLRPLFGCHQQDGHLCAGWVGTHDMDNSIALRVAVSSGFISPEEAQRTVDYVSPVPLFASGREAAEHGKRDLYNPGKRARAMKARLKNKLKDKVYE